MAGDAGCQITETQRLIWQLNRPFEPISSGGRCRIRTHVSGSEGRKDIQTTLIARI